MRRGLENDRSAVKQCELLRDPQAEPVAPDGAVWLHSTAELLKDAAALILFDARTFIVDADHDVSQGVRRRTDRDRSTLAIL